VVKPNRLPIRQSFTPIRKKHSEWMIPDFEAISPYTPMPSLNASPELPTRANAVIVVPNIDMISRNGPIERLARK